MAQLRTKIKAFVRLFTVKAAVVAAERRVGRRVALIALACALCSLFSTCLQFQLKNV